MTSQRKPPRDEAQRPLKIYCHKSNQRHRLLRSRRDLPYGGRATKKCDDFPSPHGLAHAKDYIGYGNEYDIFGSRIVPFVTPKRRASMSAMVY
jgi:hypothetical protein